MSSIRNTLTELIIKNFVDIKRKKSAKKNSKKTTKQVQNQKFSISTILINSAVNKIKDESEEVVSKEDLEEATEEEPENKVVVNGGYGTINKHYGMSPTVKYVNYDKIWSNIGTFKSKSMYENLAGSFSQSEIKSTGVLVDNKVIEKAERHFKYFVSGEVVGDVGLVPPVGANIDSKDWEKYRIMTQMSIYRPLLALFRAVV